MKSKKILIVICILIIGTLAISGCRAVRRPVPENVPQTTPVPFTDTPRQMDDGINRGIGTPDNNITTPGNMGGTGIDGNLMDRADKIVDAVVKLDEIQSATVVISEKTAVVGVNLKDSKTAEVDRELEKKVEDTVKKADSRIDRVAVTTDPDLFTRIENIAKETGRGRPLSGFGREIEEIIRRITPKV